MKQTKWLVLALLVALVALVGCEREVTGELQTAAAVDEDECFQCHNGFLDQAQGEWINSTHASGSNIDYTNRGGRDCLQCHNQQGFLEFLNTGSVPETELPVVSAIGCFACHNPHETGDLSLRTTDAYTMLNGEQYDGGDGNLCVNCHHARSVTGELITADQVVTSPYWGPHHGPQGEMLQGTGGYEGFAGYSKSSSPHNTIDNTCTHCHMAQVVVHEGYDLGGHSFNMVDEDSGEELAALCEQCHSGVDAIDFTADQDYDFDGVVEGYQTEIAGLLDSLEVLLIGEGLISGGRRVPQTIADQDLAGSLYNYLFVMEDQSQGMHDFQYAVGLLQASIAYVDGLTAPQAPGIVSQK